jgi:hypothetical protein
VIDDDTAAPTPSPDGGPWVAFTARFVLFGLLVFIPIIMLVNGVSLTAVAGWMVMVIHGRLIRAVAMRRAATGQWS